ncbi:MAG TPA: signal recognition particle protein [Cyanobacteria bacterium UBA8530]|nr:signal recognition particle protein [Cyanobacteria bacterium UBA8530]
MFESLSEKIQAVFKKLRNQGKITEESLQEALREVRRALLEADVNLGVVKEFITRIKEKALGQDVLESLTPGQQVVKIVHEELINLLGGTREPLATGSPAVILMVGLQGSGKTTTSAKLALHLKKQGHSPLLVAADIYRPAAIKQLQVLGKQIGVPVFALEDEKPLEIVRQALEQGGHDTLIVDTAGRLHIDEALMGELHGLKETFKPQEILLVVDAMTGQDAVKMSEAFNQTLGLSGVILTKMDGDTRGGAAMSVRKVTGCPIKFVAAGEKLDALEPFHPDRIATRILGMGDVLTLIEKAQESMDLKSAKELEKKFKNNQFTLEDFIQQLRQIKKIGSMEQILGMLPIPGLSGALKDEDFAKGEQHLKRIEAIINSMTVQERRAPQVIDNSRKSRIARGSGTQVQDVNKLLKQFEQMKKMMKQFSGMEKTLGKKIPKLPRGGFGFPM